MPEFTDQGHRLFYREQGRGEPLLILHGNTASSAVHPGELAHFGQRYRAVALDALGCGQSDRLAVWPVDWWKQYALHARALIAQIGAQRCIVVGTSGGAIAALWLAALAPQAVRAVVADSCVSRLSPARLHEIVSEERAQRTPGQIAFWQAAHGADWEQVIAADNQLMLALADTGGDMLAGCPLERIACSVLFTASRQDSALPDADQQQIDLARSVRAGRVYIHDTGDHPLMWSEPAVFRVIADAFLSGLA